MGQSPYKGQDKPQPSHVSTTASRKGRSNQSKKPRRPKGEQVYLSDSSKPLGWVIPEQLLIAPAQKQCRIMILQDGRSRGLEKSRHSNGRLGEQLPITAVRKAYRWWCRPLLLAGGMCIVPSQGDTGRILISSSDVLGSGFWLLFPIERNGRRGCCGEFLGFHSVSVETLGLSCICFFPSF